MFDVLITSSTLIILVLILRITLRKVVRPGLLYVLWLIVALRLLLPFSLGESAISLMNVVRPTVNEAALNEKLLSVPVGTILYGATPVLPQDSTEPTQPEIRYTEIVYPSLTTQELIRIIWSCGAATVLLTFCVSASRFWRRLSRSRTLAQKGRPAIYRVTGLATPCLYSNAIYLPDTLTDEEARFAIAHETAHYHHGDTLWNILRILLLAVYWFDPFVWVAVIVSRQDAEFAADESTVHTLGEENRILYGRILLSLTMQNPLPGDLFYAATLMTSSGRAFVRRIRTLTRHTRTVTAAIIMLAFLMVVIAGCTFTGAKTIPPAIRFSVIDTASFERFSKMHPDNSFYFDYCDAPQETFSTLQGDPVLSLDAANGILIVDITRDDFHGTLALIRNPAQVSLAISEDDGTVYECFSDLCSDALLGINASGYVSGGDQSILGQAIANGQSIGTSLSWTAVGFGADNNLYVGKYASIHAELRDAVEYKPLLIANGEIVVMPTDGWGRNPRTAIGQTADGTVCMLVIDGRSAASAGCTSRDCADILASYGVLNASSLDGGSSSAMYYNGRVISAPASSDPTHGNSMPTAFIVRAN